MLTTIALCAVSAFQKEGHTHDRNGNQNVFLSPLTGEIPNKAMVMAGTVALNNSIEIGHTYVFKFSETKESEEYGRQFNTQKISEPSALEILQAVKLGQPKVINVSDDVEAKSEEFANAESEFELEGKK